MPSFAALLYNLEAGCFYREYVTYEERKLSSTFQSLPLSTLSPTNTLHSEVKSFWHQFSAVNQIKGLSFSYALSRTLFSLKFIPSTFFFSSLRKSIAGIFDRKSFLLQEISFHILGDDLKSQIRHHMILNGSDHFGIYTNTLPCHGLLFLFP